MSTLDRASADRPFDGHGPDAGEPADGPTCDGADRTDDADPHSAGRTDHANPSATTDADVGTTTERAEPQLLVGPRANRRRRLAALASRAVQTIAMGAVGALPVLWVLGAVPWRLPTLLIENMFRGFTSCAMTDGALTPMVMVCNDAGVPLGMHQLDGGLSYPLGGALVRLGVEPLAAWKLAVAALIVPGVAALYWLIRAITAHAWIAAAFTAVYGLSAPLTARSWNWYWNITSVALLPLLFAAIYQLYVQAAERRLRPLVPPGIAIWLITLAISIEWQYAGLFATSVTSGATAIMVFARRWAVADRIAIAGGAVLGVGTIYAVLNHRLSAAGITEQFNDTLLTATYSSVDLAGFVAPDAAASILGAALRRLGMVDVLAATNVAGPQLWVAPYLGVATCAFLVLVAVARRGRWTPNPGLPDGYPLLLALVCSASIILSIGPVIWLARPVAPTAWTASPLLRLWLDTPMQWIRYPWTWAYLTHTALFIGYAAIAAALLRRRQPAPATSAPPPSTPATPTPATLAPSRSGGHVPGPAWSPLAIALVAVLTVDFVSPATLLATASPKPSTAIAPNWARIDSDDPTIERFERTALPELREVLRTVDGPVTLLPWTNGWTIPSLGPDVGLQLRNTGIDRNVARSEAIAPLTREELRTPESTGVAEMLRSGWVKAVVLLDFMPTTGNAIVRTDREQPSGADRRWRRTVRRIGRDLAGVGYCVDRGSWFTVITRCAAVPDPTSRAGGHLAGGGS